jgi:hypothetical protein
VLSRHATAYVVDNIKRYFLSAAHFLPNVSRGEGVVVFIRVCGVYSEEEKRKKNEEEEVLIEVVVGVKVRV